MGIVGTACVIVGGSLLFALLAYKAHMHWIEREARKSRAAIHQMEDEHYAGLERSLLAHAESLFQEADPS